MLALFQPRGVLDNFDGGVASCEVHIKTPDPRIYQALLDKYSPVSYTHLPPQTALRSRSSAAALPASSWALAWTSTLPLCL